MDATFASRVSPGAASMKTQAGRIKPHPPKVRRKVARTDLDSLLADTVRGGSAVSSEGLGTVLAPGRHCGDRLPGRWHKVII